MKSVYYKYIYDFIKRKIEANKNKLPNGVSIITCTNKPNTLNNIIDNFARQNYEKKELIVVINNDKIDLSQWIQETKQYENVRIFKLSEKFSLGKCLNFAVEQAKYDTIAKFDDDDYYGPKYISDTVKSFETTDAQVIGKAANFVYFVEKKLLAIRTPKEENRYVRFANGSTLVFKKEIFDKVKFRDMSLAEDVYFCHDCIKNGIRIYSTNKYHHIYFRHPVKKNHTWTISDNEFIRKYCNVIGQVENYIDYANNVNN